MSVCLSVCMYVCMWFDFSKYERNHGNMEDYWRWKKSCVTAYLWSQGSDAPVQFRTTVTTLSIRVENVSLGNTIPSALCISFKANEK